MVLLCSRAYCIDCIHSWCWLVTSSRSAHKSCDVIVKNFNLTYEVESLDFYTAIFWTSISRNIGITNKGFRSQVIHYIEVLPGLTLVLPSGYFGHRKQSVKIPFLPKMWNNLFWVSLISGIYANVMWARFWGRERGWNGGREVEKDRARLKKGKEAEGKREVKNDGASLKTREIDCEEGIEVEMNEVRLKWMEWGWLSFYHMNWWELELSATRHVTWQDGGQHQDRGDVKVVDDSVWCLVFVVVKCGREMLLVPAMTTVSQ